MGNDEQGGDEEGGTGSSGGIEEGGLILSAGSQKASRGAWVAHSVKHPTLDFDSGHDLTVREIEPGIRLLVDNAEPAWNSLSPPEDQRCIH